MNSEQVKTFILNNANDIRNNTYTEAYNDELKVKLSNADHVLANDGLIANTAAETRNKDSRLLFTKKNFGGSTAQIYTGKNSQNIAQQLQNSSNKLISFFFSDRNVQFLQNKIKEHVFETLNVLVSDQNELELFKVMQFVYANYLVSDYDCVEGSKTFIEEISYWNSEVLKIVYPNIISNIESYQGYAKFVTDGVQPMNYPVNTSIKGSKTLVNPYVKTE